MNFTAEEIEIIVHRVLEHIETPAGAARSQDGRGAELPSSDAGHKSIRVSGQVITQALLADALNGSAKVSIGPKAILTPSARDFVRHREIEIVREPAQSSSPVAVRCQIISARSTPQAAAAIQHLHQAGIACDIRISGLPAEAAAQATSALCRGEAEQIVVFTDQPEIVACLANRNERIRAAVIADSATVDRVQKSLNPNLLAIDPAAKGVYELKALLKAFVPI
jgi:hypothetical protein